MTKPQSEAERMASEYQKRLQRTRWEHAFKLKAIDPEVIDEPWKVAYLAGFKAAVALVEQWCGSAHPRSLSGIEYLNGEQSKADELHEYLERLLEPK